MACVSVALQWQRCDLAEPLGMDLGWRMVGFTLVEPLSVLHISQSKDPTSTASCDRTRERVRLAHSRVRCDADVTHLVIGHDASDEHCQGSDAQTNAMKGNEAAKGWCRHHAGLGR